jgi:hypothetical protein
MNLLELNSQPSDRQLRQFASLATLVLPLVGWLWGAAGLLLAALALAGLLFGVTGLARPKRIRPLYVGILLVTKPIGMLVGELAMLLIYFGVLLPIGLIFRIAGRDALRLKLDPEASSYWSAKTQPRGSASYYRQF